MVFPVPLRPAARIPRAHTLRLNWANGVQRRSLQKYPLRRISALTARLALYMICLHPLRSLRCYAWKGIHIRHFYKGLGLKRCGLLQAVGGQGGAYFRQCGAGGFFAQADGFGAFVKPAHRAEALHLRFDDHVGFG